MRRFAVAAVGCVFLAGCATASYAPMVDLYATGKSDAEYEIDLEECQGYARQVAGPGTSAVAGVVVGALLGAALGTVIGDSSDFAAAGAKGGALGGGLGGAAAGGQTQMDIIRNCMAGRGYSVLN